jgi:hypothetical protein
MAAAKFAAAVFLSLLAIKLLDRFTGIPTKLENAISPPISTAITTTNTPTA